MKINVERELVVKQFLNPVSKISEECTISVTPNHMSTLVRDMAGNVILYCKLNTKTNVDKGDKVDLHIKDIRKLSKVFDCIDEDVIAIDVDPVSAVMKYKSPKLSFKLHLVTDNVIRSAGFSVAKINAITYDSEFVMSGEKLSEILKGSIFATETNKIYFYTNEDGVFAELTDKANDDTDSITFEVTENHLGEPITNPLPFSLEILRLLNSSKSSEIFVRINNTYGLITFTITNPEGEIKYIIPAFTK